MLVGTLAIRDRSSGPSGSLAFEMQSARPSIIFQERPTDERKKKKERNAEKKEAERKDYRRARYLEGDRVRGDERWLYKTKRGEGKGGGRRGK